jgi:hypothetical protein
VNASSVADCNAVARKKASEEAIGWSGSGVPDGIMRPYGRNNDIASSGHGPQNGNVEIGTLRANRGVAVQMVKIQIADKAESARAFATLIRRGRVDCYRDDVYIIPEPALGVFQDMGVRYQELGRGGLDYAEKALRDSLAAQV